MAHIIADCVRETSTTTGTGTYNLAGLIGSSQDFDAVLANSDTCWYRAAMGADYEVGKGTFTAGSPDTLARTSILESSNGDAAVNWGAGVKDIILTLPGSALSALFDTTGEANRVRWDAAMTLTAAQQAQARTNISAALKGQLYGLTLSNNGSDATNDIDIAVGEAASTESTPVLMVLASALTKRLDAAWSVGTNQGGLDTGSIADTTYHVFLIQRSDSGVVDVLFSTSASAPTMPANYDRKRRIGSIIRASAAILAFTQVGDLFTLTTQVLNENGTTDLGATPGLLAITVPAGIVVQAILTGFFSQSGAGATDCYVYSALPGGTAGPANYVGGASTAGERCFWAGPTGLFTNTSSQIYFVRDLTTAGLNFFAIYTNGWIDARGR